MSTAFNAFAAMVAQTLYVSTAQWEPFKGMPYNDSNMAVGQYNGTIFILGGMFYISMLV